MQKTSGNVFSGYLGELVFHIFPRLHCIMGGASCFRSFMAHVTIFSTSPIQHLRWSSLLQKTDNSCKLLLTVVTESFVLNVAVLLDLTLKHTAEFCLKSGSHLPKKMFYFLQQKPFKNDKKCFLFHLKRSFCSQDI